ncbi:MAG TPA: glycoside hydrolase family 5 protein [Steroidobacteraceae bacterium]|nr:glycoside hydrolase family 5 protein [Steroidobacteraceae bacterium]
MRALPGPQVRWSLRLLIAAAAWAAATAGAAAALAAGCPEPAPGRPTRSTPRPSPSLPLAVRVRGNHLVDAAGAVLQLRGVNVSGLEAVAAQGWNPADPWGGQSPDWQAIRRWQANAVRIPLNEASWLGYRCIDGDGKARNPDPGGNYRSTVRRTVADATAAGLYVILDLHWSAPAHFCPLAQNPMADADHSIAFWISVAGEFKNRPNVLFELFNEPFVGYGGPVGRGSWQIIMDGGRLDRYVTGSAARYQADFPWQAAGMQQMLAAVRAQGATNVVLIGAPSWAQDLSQWTATVPADALHQIAAAWHPYPNGNYGDPKAAEPKLGAVAYTWAQQILNAGYPIVISETGDHNAPGTVGSPLLARLLPWADARHVSYLGWTWNSWANADNILIRDRAGDPTDGYGAFFKQHLACVAAALGTAG